MAWGWLNVQEKLTQRHHNLSSFLPVVVKIIFSERCSWDANDLDLPIFLWAPYPWVFSLLLYAGLPGIIGISCYTNVNSYNDSFAGCSSQVLFFYLRSIMIITLCINTERRAVSSHPFDFSPIWALKI